MKYISFAIPCYNSAAYMDRAVESILKGGEDVEIIIVNDGSKDDTSKIAHEYEEKYPTIVRAVDKENGGKSDALNAGINASSYPLFACLDADSRLERDSLLRLGNEFIKDTTTVVAGGLVRIANGGVIKDGIFESYNLPEKAIERFQTVEYFRSFLAGRTSWGVTNSMLIVSGAFGVFKKQVVIDVGGYKTDTIGEDMEIVVRIHEYMLRNKIKYKVKFVEQAICWTQGPMSLNDVRTQRRRYGYITSLQEINF